MKQTIERIENLAMVFRNAIERLKDRGTFDDEISFRSFPKGCCGDTADLLGQFLLDAGIETWYVCGTYYEKNYDEDGYPNPQTHAWLTTKDPLYNSDYLIIDITGDQFNGNPEYGSSNKAVYVGGLDSFHKLFEYDACDVHQTVRLSNLNGAAPRIIRIYKYIINELR